MDPAYYQAAPGSDAHRAAYAAEAGAHPEMLAVEGDVEASYQADNHAELQYEDLEAGGGVMPPLPADTSPVTDRYADLDPEAEILF